MYTLLHENRSLKGRASGCRCLSPLATQSLVIYISANHFPKDNMDFYTLISHPVSHCFPLILLLCVNHIIKLQWYLVVSLLFIVYSDPI